MKIWKENSSYPGENVSSRENSRIPGIPPGISMIPESNLHQFSYYIEMMRRDSWLVYLLRDVSSQNRVQVYKYSIENGCVTWRISKGGLFTLFHLSFEIKITILK
jgi:hypothetical protein